MTETKTTTTAQLSGTGRTIALGELRDWLDARSAEFPSDARVSVLGGGDQRDGDWFRLTVTHSR